MATQYLNPKFSKSLNQKFREKRFKLFISLINLIKKEKPIRILDIGGTEIFWERMNFLDAGMVDVTLLNLKKVPTRNDNFVSIKGDASDLSQFKDNEFDIVFSNSVIEHLYTKDNQKKMADEARRVGKYYYIQTPNYYFPIEPHWLFPCFQFLPFGLKVFLTDKFNLGHRKSSSKEHAIEMVKEVRLLTGKEMKAFFPDGKIYREIFMGLTKSVTLYRFPG